MKTLRAARKQTRKKGPKKKSDIGGITFSLGSKALIFTLVLDFSALTPRICEKNPSHFSMSDIQCKNNSKLTRVMVCAKKKNSCCGAEVMDSNAKSSCQRQQ